MIISQSKLKVCDNSGVKYINCLKVYSVSVGLIGSLVFSSVKEVKSKSKLRKGDVVKGIIVRIKNPLDRKTGFYISFDSNDIVLLNNKQEPLGTRIFGPLTLELRKKNLTKLLSLSSILT